MQLVDAQTRSTRAPRSWPAKSLLPQSELDAAKVAVDTAQAAVQSQQATVTQAQAAVKQSQASVHQNQVNLDHTVITAPIDGIVTQRSVDVGQTVAASMQAPTLFIIAADLTKMQVNANIDEADVGRIRPGQPVTFRVDAYPDRATSTGTVSQVRLQPKVVQNVTTYGTVIDVPNPQLKLKPGMTANVKVEIAKRTDVLRVPNAALRFRPTAGGVRGAQSGRPPEAGGGAAARRTAAGAGRARRGHRDSVPAGAPTGGRIRPRTRPLPRDRTAGAPATGGSAAAPIGFRRRRHRASVRGNREQAAARAAARRRRRSRLRRRRWRRRTGFGGGGGATVAIRRRMLGALQDDVAGRAEAVPRADEGSRSGHQPRSKPR